MLSSLDSIADVVLEKSVYIKWCKLDFKVQNSPKCYTMSGLLTPAHYILVVLLNHCPTKIPNTLTQCFPPAENHGSYMPQFKMSLNQPEAGICDVLRQIISLASVL